jgi:hypothetical protein|tara:strand:+ start:2018 stop:3208 length:1191 start_codon:yes stop_codon:yes gene_type:complete
MVSTFSDRNRLEKQGDGENKNSWGTILNNNVDLLDEALGGYQVVSVSAAGAGNYTLTTNNGVSDTSRQAALEFSGTLTADVTIVLPSKEKTYLIRENSSGSFAVKMKTAAGSLITLAQGQNTAIMCDGTEIYKLTTPTSVATFTATHLDSTSISATNILATNIFATSVSASVFTGVNGTFTGTVSASAFDGLGNKLTYGTDAQGDILYHDGTDIQNLAAGTSGQFLKTLGAAANPAWATAGRLVQAVHTQDGETATSSPGSFLDDTIPIDSDGFEFTALDTTITPTNASNKLLIEVNINIAVAGANYIHMALFQDGIGDGNVSAVAAMSQYQQTSGVSNQISLSYEMVAGTTSATTFHIRASSSSAGTITYNGTGGTSRLFGGVMASTMRITEIAV